PARLRVVDGPRADGPRPITSGARPHVSNANAMMLSLLTLFFTTPLAMYAVREFHPLAAIPCFALGVFWAANRFGWRGAFRLVFVAVPVPNFLFEAPAGFRYSAFACLILASFMREATDLAREYVEPLVLNMFLRIAGTR